jgi:DNA-binding winged helix-turn-helix (wHTH) protein/tetratricopeptide (TPR) repeat protein
VKLLGNDGPRRFGPFELYADGRLLRNASVVPLAPKLFETLRMLVEAEGRIVTRDELMASVWGDAFVEEGSLTYTISMLRKALGEHEGERYIETVPKRGYRFVARVDESGGAIERLGTPSPDARAPADLDTMTRLIILPFKILRSDPETDFLAFGIPDAIASALSGLHALIVRSSLASARFWPDADPKRIAAEANVDVVLAGTLVRAGDRLRVMTHLIDAEGGTLIWSHTWDATLSDLLQLQDDLTRRIVESLGVPLTARDRRTLGRHRPATAAAYEHYLRANQSAYQVERWEEARDRYRACIAADPTFAPAWARLARCYRLIAKYALSNDVVSVNIGLAEEAFTRALTIDPELSLTHQLYAQLEIDRGRADAAMNRLLARAAEHPHDADVFAGLVHACRFCGLLGASIGAHLRARALDPTIPTSVSHSYWMAGDARRALDETFGDIGYMPGLALASLGRTGDAIAALRWREGQAPPGRARLYLVSLRALFEGHEQESLAALDDLAGRPDDPEGSFYVARSFAYWQRGERAVRELTRAVDGGFFCWPAMEADSWLARVRGTPGFDDVLARARERHERARSAFQKVGWAESNRGVRGARRVT